MSIEVICVQCGTSHHVNDRMAGRRVRCPCCETAVHVPEAEMNLDSPDAVEEVEAVAIVEEVEAVEVEAVEVEAVAVQPIDVAATTVASKATVSPAPGATMPLGNNAVPLGNDDEDEDLDEVLVRNKRPEEEMDMTPMVDVTFLLLIFFMVTAAFSLQKSIKMPRQQTDAPSSAVQEEQEEIDSVEVQVDEVGSFLVMAPDWERETPGKQNLITALKEAIAGHDNGMKLQVKVHELAKLHSLVDAMDAGTIAGYSDLEVTQVEDFD